MPYTYDLGSIRRLIVQALTPTQFEDLLFDKFPSVYDETQRMSLPERRRALVDYANRQRRIPELLDAIDEYNPSIAKCDILVLAANPAGMNLLQLDEEASLIRQRLEEGQAGRNFVVRVKRVVRIEDLSKHLLQYDPLILHFSGHGSPDGSIILPTFQGQTQGVSPERLAELLAVVRGRLECVILNACFSLEKADALADQVSCVVGMDAEIDDRSAISFAEGFYRGLGSGRGYYTAFELGRIQMKLSNPQDGTVPHFITRDYSILQSETVKPRVTRTSTSTPSQIEATQYPLWFGTDRKPIDPQNISKRFSTEYDCQIHYGTCQVTVPKSHKIGSTGSPWWQRLLTVTDDRLKLVPESLDLLDAASFFTNIRQALQTQELDKQSALVFIHGFNVSFEDAALQAAQIGVDLQMQGIMAFYSWPSQGKLMGYTADEATIEGSEQYIAEFLLNLGQKSGVNKIHIIAHSMGNRGLLRAMQRILFQVQATSDISFGQIFLAAPDVDPRVFQNLAVAYQQLAERTTLYVSAKDKALATSGIIHNHPRLGFFPPIEIVDGIDTVEVSNIDVSWLGHGYFAEARGVLQDIHQLLMHNTSPEERFGLRSAQAGEQRYWRIMG